METLTQLIYLFIIMKLKPYVMSSVLRLTIDEMKPSWTIIPRIVFQSDAGLSSKSHTDSRANFTTAGGLAIERTSANCFFLMELTAEMGFKTKLYKQHKIGLVQNIFLFDIYQIFFNIFEVQY